jgi:hypothetical protein
LVWWHTPNGGYRRAAEARVLAGQGVLPGVADICALHRGAFYALEIKTEDGRPTAAQLEFIDRVNAAGGFATVANGIDACLRVLERWQLLRGTAA